MPVEVIECDSDSSNGWKESDIDKLKKAIINTRPRGVESNIIRHPKLVLSVVGDSSSFVPKPWLTPVFQLGLIETAKGAKDCVILYKGSNERVSTLVRKAVDDFCVMNNQKETINEEAKNSTFISLISLQPDDKEKKKTESTEEENRIPINNPVVQRHFKLKDSSSNNKEKRDNYRMFYAEVLESVAKEYVPLVELECNFIKMNVPVLVVVAEGDLNTLDVVVEVLKKCIPVLILQGSGKAADLIAECMHMDSPEDIVSIEAKAPLLLGIYLRQKEIKHLKECMKEINICKHFVNIFDITKHNETEFSDAVVNSIIRGWAQGEKMKDQGEKTEDQGEKTEDLEIKKCHCIKPNIHIPDLYDQSSPDIAPEIVTTSNCIENNHGTNRNTKNGRSIKRNSIQPETAVPLKLRVEEVEEVEEFMSSYKNSLTPASLRLYFYLAYQFIQQYYIKNELKQENFQILLKEAIIADREDYVTVLLQEENVQFRKEDFPEIYAVINCGCNSDGDCQHIKSILKGASEKATKTLLRKKEKKTEEGKNKQKKDGDGKNKQKEDEKNKQKEDEKNKQKKARDVIEAGRQLCQKFLHYPKSEFDYKSYCGKQKKGIEEETDKQEIYQDLLIWSLFANRPQMATLFWMKCKNQLLTAILARCVLRKMAKTAKSGKDMFLFNAFTEHESVFEKRAIDLQTMLYQEDPEVAMELMLADQTVWDIQVTPLDCAFDNVMLDVIAHSCAQRRLNKIWYKKIGTGYGNFFKNGCLNGCKKQKVNEEKKLVLFRFLYAPLTRFLLHYIIFLAAMVCFSAFLLIELSEYIDVKSIKIYEWLIYLWLLGDIFEEYRGILPWNNEVIKSKFSNQEACRSSQSTWYRLKRYIKDFWNSLDVLFYCITIAAILVRFLYTDPSTKLARRLYSLSLFMMYMRFLHALLMSRTLGPKIIMIKEMLKDLFRFIGILFIFMIGVGVLYHANMYPAHYDLWNTAGWTYWRIWKIIYIPYWQIYGELFLDKFEDNSTTPCTTIQSEWESNPDIERCNQYDWVLIVISALYMLMSNLLLVNLVIALFSYRFEIVQNNSEKLWRYWRYAVIMDYRQRFPAPLNLMIRPFTLVYKCIKKKDNGGIKPEDNDAINRMKRIQSISANKCIRQELMNKKKKSA